MAPPFHPDLAASARWLPHGVARRWTLPLLRGLLRMSAAVGSRREEVRLDGGSVLVYRPHGVHLSPRPALLWIHGGGLLFGDARQDEPFVHRVVEELGFIVASVQYRVGPQHPFPTPLEDCEEALQWLVRQPEVDPARLMVGGASAGGGLAAALCQLTREKGGPQPGFQLLVQPMLDDRSGYRTDLDDSVFRVWDRPANRLGWSSYLRGHEPEAPPPFAVPARTPDLSGLPPAWIGVGSLDLFHDEALAYAERLEQDGVAVQLDVVEGAYHGFDAVQPQAPVSRAFRDRQLAAMAAWVAGQREA